MTSEPDYMQWSPSSGRTEELLPRATSQRAGQQQAHRWSHDARPLNKNCVQSLLCATWRQMFRDAAALAQKGFLTHRGMVWACMQLLSFLLSMRLNSNSFTVLNYNLNYLRTLYTQPFLQEQAFCTTVEKKSMISSGRNLGKNLAFLTGGREMHSTYNNTSLK